MERCENNVSISLKAFEEFPELASSAEYLLEKRTERVKGLL